MEDSRLRTTTKRSSGTKDSTQSRAAQPLRYRTYILWLLLLYVTLIVLPWIFTCILARRPVNADSYSRPSGFTYREYVYMTGWPTLVAVANTIAATVTVPILSAVLAQAVVVFCQRKRPEEFLSVKGIFALSDRGWTNLPILWKALRQASWSKSAKRSIPGRKSSGLFLAGATGLIILGVIHQPLYQVLISYDIVAVTMHASTSYNGSWIVGASLEDPKALGVDMEPAEMAAIPQFYVRNRVASELATISITENQPNLWLDNVTAEVPLISQFGSPLQTLEQVFATEGALGTLPRLKYFVASIPANTTTGVLREHLMRLNSSIECEEIDSDSIPSPCPGDNPFTATFQRGDETNVSICVPGNQTAFPWMLTRNNQHITEDIYMDIWDTAYAPYSGAWPNDFGNVSGAVHCVAKTTRGFFELGNTQNNLRYGQLLEKWPDRDQMENEFNDWAGAGGYVPSEVDTYVGDPESRPYTYLVGEWQTPGPLALSASTLFGNGSWLESVFKYTANMSYTDETGSDPDVWQLTCRGMPFSRLWPDGKRKFLDDYEFNQDFVTECRYQEENSLRGIQNTNEDLMIHAHDLLSHFAPRESRGVENAEKLLEIGMFAANRAMVTFLSPEIDPYSQLTSGRIIWGSPGANVIKPVVSEGALITITILLSIQLLILGYLVYYIYRSPTWTDQLDSMALMRIGASLGERGLLPPIGGVSKEDMAALEKVQGLIGVVEKDANDEDSVCRTVSPDETVGDCESLSHSSQQETQANAGRRAHIEPHARTSEDETQPIVESRTDVESQLIDNEEKQQTPTDAEDGSPDVQLALGASGAITSDLVKRPGARTLGKKTWGKLCDWYTRPSK